MELTASLLQLSAIHLLMAMVPGPNTVLVGHVAASRSRRAGVLAALGLYAGARELGRDAKLIFREIVGAGHYARTITVAHVAERPERFNHIRW